MSTAGARVPLRIQTAPYRYAGADRLDVTRVGCDRAVQAGKPAPGIAFAPSAAILWPAMAHLDLVAALERRASALPPGEAAAATALHAAQLLPRIEAAYEQLYVAEMRVSAGARPGSPRWGTAEDAAVERGVCPRPEAWRGLLAREAAVLVCFCGHREPGGGQRHTCHRHYLARCLAAFGAVDAGEIELPPARDARPRAAPPLEAMVAVSGARPPKQGAPREHHALHRAILADVAAAVQALPPGTVVVHGGAEGVDSTAGAAARRAELAAIIVRPWYDAWGRAAPTIRNTYVATCPRLLAWPAPWSSPGGTPAAMALARAAGVAVEVREV